MSIKSSSFYKKLKWIFLTITFLALFFQFKTKVSYEIVFMIGSLFGIAGGLFLVFRRPLLSLMLSSFIIHIIYNISYVKFKNMKIPLLDSDFGYEVLSVLPFLIKEYTKYFSFFSYLLFIFSYFLFFFSIIYFYKKERPLFKKGVFFSYIFVSIISFLLLKFICTPPDNYRMRTSFDSPLYSFYNSIVNKSLKELELIPSGASYSNKINLPQEKIPKNKENQYNIITSILVESNFDTRKLGVQFNENVFSSFFINSHPLNVFVYGGGTCDSDFDFLFGISHNSIKYFGNPPSFSYFLFRDRLRHSLPFYLKKQGYKTIVIDFMDKNFIRAKDFFLSIGFDHYYDRNDFSIPGDDFSIIDEKMFPNAIEIIKSKYKENPNEKLYVHIITISQHAPYNPDCSSFKVILNKEYQQLSDVQKSVFCKADDYLQRQKQTASLISNFKKELDELTRPNHQKWAMLTYGDHQPSLTTAWKDIQQGSGPTDLFETIISFDDSRKKQISYPKEPIDIGYLSTYFLKWLDFPIENDPVYQYRNFLLKKCPVYSSCDPNLLGPLHNYLINQKLINLDRLNMSDSLEKSFP